MQRDRRRIVVIGAGISGLTAAHYLSRKHEVTVLEREPRLGGHTHTVTVASSQGPLAVDTGFIVHNRKTYPNFCRLMDELGVATQPSDMSFAVTAGDGGFEYSSHGLGGFFAQRANLWDPTHYRLLRDILRFNREAAGVSASGVTIAEFLAQGRYSDVFRDRYLYPMASAVWSMPLGEMGVFPAATLIRFFDNHGMLGINTHPQWRTIRGGSHTYIPPMIRPFEERIQTGVEIRAVRRTTTGVVVEIEGSPSMTFDDAVFACHGDQVLPLLADATPVESRVLADFRFTRNEAVLHTDDQWLPRRAAARASWNYILTADNRVSLTYDMNRLQSLTTPETFCVTLNPAGIIDKDKVVKRIEYHHPRFDQAAIEAQARWGEISGRSRVHFCGAYWFYGFHEDGVRSALRVASALGVEP